MEGKNMSLAEQILKKEMGDLFSEEGSTTTEDTNMDYAIVTDGKNLPHQLPRSKELYAFFSNYKEITHTTASLVGTLAAVSMVGAGRVRTYSQAPVTTYITYIAPTASSKDPVIKGLCAIDRAVNKENTITKSGDGLQSSGALDTTLRSCTGQLVLTIDEFGDILGEITQGANSSKGTLKAPFKRMYSMNHGDIYEGSIYSDQGGKIKSADPVKIESLAFGIVGITTKSQLMTHVESKHLADGTINRFMFIDGTQHESNLSGGHGEFNIPPALQTHLDSFQIIDERTELFRLDDDALVYWDLDVGHHTIKRGLIWEWCKDDETKLNLAGRIKENALRLATALAYFEHFETVPKWLLEWCFNFTLLNMDHFYELYQEHDENDGLLREIDAIMHWWEKEHKSMPLTRTFLAREGGKFRKMKSAPRKMMIEELLERGLIKETRSAELVFVSRR